MNYVEVKGGLGNQLFQYTFHKYCEKRSGCVTLLHTEFFKYVKTLEGATQRDFKLNKFGCDFMGICGAVTCEQIVEEEEFGGIDRGTNEVFYRGYWQNKEFFEEVRQDILRTVCLKEEYITKDLKEAASEIERNNAIAIHIRRGDYLNEVNRKIFGALSVDYYRNAIAEIMYRCGTEVKVFVFTEDTEYAREIMDQFGDLKVEIMPVREDYEDLYLMSRAKHHVIANSSFSWWGAAISTATDGVTIAPKNWFLDRPSPNLYLDGWIVL